MTFLVLDAPEPNTKTSATSPGTNVSTLALPVLAAPTVSRVSYTQVDVTLPAKPAGWTSELTLVVSVRNPASGWDRRTVVGSDWTPGATQTTTGMASGAAHVVTFLVLDAPEPNTKTSATSPGTNVSTLALPVLAAPTVSRVSYTQVDVTLPAKPAGWTSELTAKIEILDPLGHMAGANFVIGSDWTPGSTVTLTGLASGTNYVATILVLDAPEPNTKTTTTSPGTAFTTLRLA